MEVGWIFGQVSPCFGPWLLLGIMYFVGLRGVSGSRGIWVEGGACLIRNGGEEGFGRIFSRDPPVLGHGSH